MREQLSNAWTRTRGVARSTVTTGLEVAGVLLVVAGVAFYSVPVAFVVAGSAVLLGCWRATT